MGNGIVSNKKKKQVERRPPIKSTKEILNSQEAKVRIQDAMKHILPGTPLRWDKILNLINHDPGPTEEIPDPLRIEIDMKELCITLKMMYDGLKQISSDGLALSRDNIPKIFDKHSFERAKRVSQKEREERLLSDDCYAYGEINPDIFASIYLKIASVYRTTEKGIFYDLGCGVGTLVYTAAFVGDFSRVIGVDNIRALLERGEKRQERWETMKSSFTQQAKIVEFDWIEDNFVLADFWQDASFIFLHWTAFSTEQREKVGKTMAKLKEGTQVVSLTNPIPGSDFAVLVEDQCETSWGQSKYFFQEKVTPYRKNA